MLFFSLSCLHCTFFYLSSLPPSPTLSYTHTHIFAHQYPLSLQTRRLLNLHLAAWAVEAVKVVEVVDQQVVPGPPLQVRRASLLPTRTLVVVAEVEHGRQLVPWQFLPPEGREKSMLVPLRTVVGQSFYIHTPSYTYTHSHAHTHTHTHTHTHMHLLVSAACLLAPIDCHSYTDDEGALSDSVIEFSAKKRTGTRRRSASAGAKSKHVIGSTRTRKGGRNSGISSDSGKSLSIRFCFSLVYTAHFFTCPPSFTYPLSHTHTHTHIFPPIPSITPDEKAAEPSSGSKSRGGRQGRGIGRPAGCPRATLASKKSKPSSHKDAGRCGRGRTRTSAGTMAISPTRGKGEEHAGTSEDSGRSIILHAHSLVYIYTLTCIHTHTHTYTHTCVCCMFTCTH